MTYLTRHSQGSFAVLLASVLWGTTGTAASFAEGVSPVAIGAVTTGGGGLLLCLFSFSLYRSHLPTLLAHKGLIIVSTLCISLYPLAFYSSMYFAGVAIGTIVSLGSAPILTALLERVLDKKALTKSWLVACVAGLSGITLLTVSEGQISTHSESLLGIILGLIAGATYAFYSWGARKLIGAEIPSRVVMGSLFGLASCLLLPLLFWYGAPLAESVTNLSVALYLAVFPMLGGYLLFGFALARIPASYVTTLTLLEPVVATLLSLFVLGEVLSLSGWSGLLLIMLSLVLLVLSSPDFQTGKHHSRLSSARKGMPHSPAN